MRALALAALLVAGLAPAPLAAEPARSRTAQADPHAECYCRAKGRFFGMGDQTCLRSPEGPRMARCVMEQNVTSWRFSQDACPES